MGRGLVDAQAAAGAGLAQLLEVLVVRGGEVAHVRRDSVHPHLVALPGSAVGWGGGEKSRRVGCKAWRGGLRAHSTMASRSIRPSENSFLKDRELTEIFTTILDPSKAA